MLALYAWITMAPHVSLIGGNTNQSRFEGASFRDGLSLLRGIEVSKVDCILISKLDLAFKCAYKIGQFGLSSGLYQDPNQHEVL